MIFNTQEKVHNFVKEQKEKYQIKGKVLDIGSMDINGSVKDLFDDYVGLDMRQGKNVDIVANAHEIPFSDAFDCVVCCEMLEHDDNPFLTAKEIRRVLKVGGYLILTASGISFPKHEYPSDYWRFTGDGLRVLFKDLGILEVREDENEVYLIAQKWN